jgi:putative NADPH-quinone reductase
VHGKEKLKGRKHLPFVAQGGPAHRVDHGRETPMSKSKHTLFEAVLARMSLGAVPMDGVYWFDPKAMRERAAEAAEKAKQEKSREHCDH